MAAADFNPYHFWLGIPADVEEPNHFQLLGLSESESDPNVITSSALRQSGFVRNFQRGEHADVATRILDEIEAAKLVLQHESRRREYLATLSPTTIDNQDGIDLVVANRPVRQATHRDHRTTRDHRYAIGICVGVLLVIVTAFVIRPGHKTDSATPIVTPSTDVDDRPQTGEGASAPITPSKDGLAQAPEPVVRPSSARPSTKTTGAETQQTSTHFFGTLKGHYSSVSSVSFSPDGKRIVSGSDDNTLKVWDISSLDTSK
jgi:WD40 repeat protein